MNVADAYVGLISMSEEERKPFIGKKVGFKTTVNVNELYKNPSQRAAVLQVKEDELEGINPEFSLEITKIRKFAEPELNEEFFKMAFPAGAEPHPTRPGWISSSTHKSGRSSAAKAITSSRSSCVTPPREEGRAEDAREIPQALALYHQRRQVLDGHSTRISTSSSRCSRAITSRSISSSRTTSP